MRHQDRKLLDKMTALPAGAVLRLYTDFLEESPEWAVIAASALRVKARQGELPEELLPILFMSLSSTPDVGCLVHLAKTFAAFGRGGQMAAPVVVERARELHITDDAYFWIFDSLLHCLGYLGGDEAIAFVDELAAERPLRVNVSDSVYQGEMSSEERAELHRATLAHVAAQLRLEDAGAWTKKATSKEWGDQSEDAGEEKKLSPWMVR